MRGDVKLVLGRGRGSGPGNRSRETARKGAASRQTGHDRDGGRITVVGHGAVFSGTEQCRAGTDGRMGSGAAASQGEREAAPWTPEAYFHLGTVFFLFFIKR